MTDRIAPNPPSAYATAPLTNRHLFIACLGADPQPGDLVMAACNRLSVVPDWSQTLDPPNDGVLPPGLCGLCVDALRGLPLPPNPNPRVLCSRCGTFTRLGRWCYQCRITLHDQQRAPAASRP